MTVMLWWYHPTFYFPWLQLVFFKTFRMVSCVIFSTCFSSTILSANILNDHLENPSGALLQLSAIKCASLSPSTLGSLVFVIGYRSRHASNPSSTNRCFILSIIRILIFNTRLISLPVSLSPYFPSSQFNRTYPVRYC